MYFSNLFLAVFDNLSKFAMLVFIHEFSRIFAEKYKTILAYPASLFLALTITLLGYNGYSEYPRDFEYATIIFFTIWIPSVLGVYRGLRIKPQTLDQLIYTRRYFPEYRLLSDQQIITVFREFYPKLMELSDKEIMSGLEKKYSSVPINQEDSDIFTLLINTRKKFPEYKNISDKQIVSIFKEKIPELKESVEIGVIMHLEKKYGEIPPENNPDLLKS
jgi:hypothetical protein